MAKMLGPVRRAFQPWNDPSQPPFIEFRNVTKRFGDFTAVDNQSITVYEREFYALLGPSGCGKTTLLRMLAGFEEPSEGEIFLDGRPLTGVPPHKRPVNMMFQSYALFPHMNVADNIAFGLKQEGMAKADIAVRVEEMLRLVKLQDFARRKPAQLSGGQQQRVALARALAKRPKVLLLDEPLGALDKKLREETQFELTDLQESLGLTFLIVTHDQEEAMTMADRIAVMDHGRVIQVATPAVIYEAPASRYIADFVGDVNIFEGRIAHLENGGLTMTTAAGFTVEVAEMPQGVARPQAGETIWFAIRPEKMVISHERPPNATTNVIEGEVWDIGYLGDVSIYNIKLDSGDVVRATRLNASREVERPLTWEDRVFLSWRPDAGTVLVR
ncbi:ABC transporter ATP-binding protein [Afifella marina]|uniref:Spermidine/putrescine import ATP-binding protein PotA n=1 Tax=Afifella marina DSM 2698 TaxID=1120955 RepID=A0A1G5M918_AFIMA|nr:ABC transporter ATP-binding protein [Afifella marina]MBK1622889.1 ABC transporter ATP-binding protein [Afifella marina DSM 2698]MBK1625884.1 ABC transporter ATP-binding protein [Afifella marina]MBK5917706.1 polyamine ABC transporter ATP-binding protein [Afifella marina]RAI23627.1 polyamine ABC transporter ATP-binding protein [Afifella marina DSM 2698]SCZ20910.1 putrescine transport system ATP-binding protein [Afifella marina DSM 2698]